MNIKHIKILNIIFTVEVYLNFYITKINIYINLKLFLI